MAQVTSQIVEPAAPSPEGGGGPLGRRCRVTAGAGPASLSDAIHYRGQAHPRQRSERERPACTPAVRHQPRSAPREAPTHLAQATRVLGSVGESMTGITMPTHRLRAWGTAVSALPDDTESGLLVIFHAIRDTIDRTRIVTHVPYGMRPTPSTGPHGTCRRAGVCLSLPGSRTPTAVTPAT